MTLTCPVCSSKLSLTLIEPQATTCNHKWVLVEVYHTPEQEWVGEYKCTHCNEIKWVRESTWRLE